MSNDVFAISQVFSLPETNINKNGERHTSFPSFFEPIMNRTTLTIYRYARAVKVVVWTYCYKFTGKLKLLNEICKYFFIKSCQIHLDKSSRRAVGVTYIRHGRTHYVSARNEIILSAGVIDSPRLLLLSGIGPKHHLQSVGVSAYIAIKKLCVVSCHSDFRLFQ